MCVFNSVIDEDSEKRLEKRFELDLHLALLDFVFVFTTAFVCVFVIMCLIVDEDWKNQREKRHLAELRLVFDFMLLLSLSLRVYL